MQKLYQILGLDEKKKQNDHMSDVPSSALKGDLTRLIKSEDKGGKSNFELATSRFITDADGIYTSYTIGEEQARVYGVKSGEQKTYLPKDGIITPGVRYDVNYVRMDSEDIEKEEVNRTDHGLFLEDVMKPKEDGDYRYVLRDEKSGKSMTLFTPDGKNFYTHRDLIEYEKITPTPSKIEHVDK